MNFKESIMLKKTIYLLPLSSLILSLSACSHAYNNNFGLVEDITIDKQLEQEKLASQKELEQFNKAALEVEEFKPEEGTFLAEDYVQPEDLITYKYDYDAKFYSEDELPENKGRLGNVVIKVPDSMSKEEAILQVESERISF